MGAGDEATAAEALGCLSAERFDHSADVDDLSAGCWDPGTQGDVPPRIADQPVAERLSFHFRSAYCASVEYL